MLKFKMAFRTTVFLLAMMILLSTGITQNNANAQNKYYSDLDGHWAEVLITSLTSEGKLNGYPDGTIRPDDNITRAEAVHFFNKYFSIIYKKENSYLDVENDAWYKEDFDIAEYYNYLDDSDYARPLDDAIRLEIFFWIVRHFSIPLNYSPVVNGENFDEYTVEERAVISALYHKGIIQGDKDNKLNPSTEISRAEYFMIIYRVGLEYGGSTYIPDLDL